MINRCDQHRFAGLFPCPYPRCGNGTASVEIIENYGIGLSTKYSRRSLVNLDGELQYFWHQDEEPVVLTSRYLIRNELTRANEGQVNTIYHYTSMDAFLAVVESRSIWLTDYGYLNDASEVEHGLRIAKDIFAKTSNQGGPPLFTLLDLPADGRPRICVACFSLDGDSLSQWRAYSRATCGIAIGFKPRQLIESIGHSEAKLSRVIYLEEQKRRAMRSFVHYFQQAWAIDTNQNNPDWMELYPSLMHDIFFDLLAVCKDARFSDERECRLVYQEDLRLYDSLGMNRARKRFRTSGALLVPYTSTNDLYQRTKPESFAMSEIVIGPHAHADLVARGVREFLDESGHADVPVRKSEVPFR